MVSPGKNDNMAESGTQFEAPSSRPGTAEGRVVMAGKYTPAEKQRSQSTEPRVGGSSMNVSHQSDKMRKSGGSPTAPGQDRAASPTGANGTKFPFLHNSGSKSGHGDPTPFLLPLQRVYAPNLLINHTKAMRSTVRISPAGGAGDDSLNKSKQANQSASFDEGLRSRSAASLRTSSMLKDSSQTVTPQQSQLSVTAPSPGAAPSIFGSTTGPGRSSQSKTSQSMNNMSKRDSVSMSKEGRASKTQEQAKPQKATMEELDTFMPSAKELKEAKELFRQFDTEGDGTLTIAEIQSSLYFNNVDYEEIQAIFGPNGIKGMGPNGTVSVEEFASFLCRRRRENANRQQSSHVSKHSRIARVYVSSCVHQHAEERRVLHEKVFPKFVELCESMGGEFIPVDLRYQKQGEGEEVSGLGPSQSEAMSELAQVATEKNYLYLGLVADLPGECVLPSEVSNAEFEALKASAKILEAASDEKGLPQALENLYAKDMNAITTTYVLRNGTEHDMSMVLKAFAEHEGEEKGMHSSLGNSFSRIRAKISRSLNEQEVNKCLSLGSELDQAKRTFVALRTVEDMPLDKLLNVLPGKTEDEVLQVVDRQNIFRENIVERLGQSNIIKLAVPYSAENVQILDPQGYAQKAPVLLKSKDYLDKFAMEVYHALYEPIVEMLNKQPATALEMELDSHVNLMRRNSTHVLNYEGQNPADSDPIVKDILEYIHGSPTRMANVKLSKEGPDLKTRKKAKEDLEKQPIENSPLIVAGGFGSGKTALLATVAERFSYSKEAGHCALIYRCIGSTPLSSDGRLLLDGLCEELSRLLGTQRTGPRPPQYNSLLVEFAELLRMLGNKKTVVMFLDGLAELPDTDHARRLSWLPVTLPNNVMVVASSLPDSPPAISRYPKQNIRMVDELQESQYDNLVKFWLDNHRQNLQPSQKEDVINTAKALMQPEVCGMRSYLRFCFDEATNHVASDAAAEKITDINTSPGVLIFECLGLIVASHGGLLESELRQLLNVEDTTGLPFLRFHKMLQRLSTYTTTRERDSRTVLTLRHDSYGTIIRNIEAFQNRMKEWNRQLAEFYAQQPTSFPSEASKPVMNYRKLRYIVYYQLEAEMWEETCNTLCSIETIQAMCEAGMSVELQRMFTSAIRKIPPEFESDSEPKVSLKTVQIFYRFFIRTVQGLSQHSRMIEQPGIVVQMAANEPVDTLPERQAHAILDKDGDSRVWMQAINKAVSVSPLYATLAGSETVVRCSHVSFDGSLIATGGDSGDVQIWDAETGERVTALEGHTGSVNGLYFVPGSLTLVSCSSDSTAKVWDEPSTACLCTYQEHEAPLLGLAISPNGDLVATCCQDSTIHVWKIDGTKVQVLKGHSAAVRACCFTMDASKLASASLDKTVKVWNLGTGKSEAEFEHKGKVYDVHFTKDAKKLISSSAFATCTLWSVEGASADAEKNTPVTEYKTGSGSCFSCSLVNDDKYLCMASEHGAIYFWDIEKNDKSLLELHAHTEIIYRTSTSLDGSWLVTSGADKVTKVWNLNTIYVNIEAESSQQEAAPAEEDADTNGPEREHAMMDDKDAVPEEVAEQEDAEMPDIVRSIAMSADGQYGVSCSEHGSLLVWDLQKAEMLMRCKCPAVARVVKFNPHQSTNFLAACDDGFIRVFNIEEMQRLGASVCSKEIGFHDFCIRSLRFAKDGVRFLTGSIDGTARVWSLNSISQEMCLTGHKDTVLDADMSSNLTYIVTASSDKTVRVWNARTGKEAWTGKHGAYVYSCTFSPDCRRAISASGDRTARVWAAKKGECLHILKGSSAFLTCSINEHANLLMCAGYEGSLQFWDIKAFEAAPVDGIGHGAEIRSAEFSKYGSYAVTACNDGSVRVFDSRTGTSLGALPVQFPVYSMAALIDEERALCMCGDEQGNVIVVRISGVLDSLGKGNTTFQLDQEPSESFQKSGKIPAYRSKN